MKYLQVVLSLVLLSSCASEEKIKVEVINRLSFERNSEVVKLSDSDLTLKEGSTWSDFAIVDSQGQLQILQYVDENKDGVLDGLLFQPSVAANRKVEYYLKKIEEGEVIPSSENECFSRFVPERTDDYAWENDKVAFRTFGPTAQKMKEEGAPGGTLSSGVDCWLKKVEYPIIDKWYAKNTDGTGSYHEDTGEGLDNFHVGISRGCGGIAVKKGEHYWSSKNFTAYQTLNNGPMQTSFALDYAAWEIDESKKIKTSKTMSLDRGNQLTRIEVSVDGVDTITAGLTLHENDGEVTIDSLGGWISYWQPHGDSFLGTAIVASPGSFLGAEKVVSSQADLSHAYLHLAVKNGTTVYYTGFFWQKSK